MGLIFVKSPSNVWTPASLTHATNWMDANDPAAFALSTLAVDSWTDKSSNAQVFSGTTTERPTYTTNLLNGKPGVVFNGTTNKLVGGSTQLFDETASWTAIIVATVTSFSASSYNFVLMGKSSSGTPLEFLFSDDSGNNYNDFSFGNATTTSSVGSFTLASATPGTPHRIIVNYAGGGVSTAANYSVFDGASTRTIHSNASLSGGVNNTLGHFGTGAGFLNGAIHEIIVSSPKMTAGELSNSNSYLLAKWGV